MTPLALRPALALAVLLALLAGCAAPGPAPEAEPEHLQLSEQAAGALSDGRLADAADLLERAAASAPPDVRAALLIDAAELRLRLAEPDAARRLLESIRIPAPSAEVEARRQLLWARLLRLDGELERAAGALAPGPDAGLPPDLRREWLQLQAALQEASGQALGAARSRDRLSDLLTDPDAIEVNRRALWNALDQVPLAELQQLVPPPPDRFGGWLELAYVLRQYALDAERLRSEVPAWQLRYPTHPAFDMAAELLASQLERLTPPRRIALMLPLSGRLAAAGQAVQRGFLAALYAVPAEARPALQVLDVGEGGVDPLTAYRQAVEWDAGLVVGPLTKEGVSRLAVRDDVPVPVLALNTLAAGEAPPGPFFQFGLAPEDDAAAAAALAWEQGHRQLLLLAPFSDWGNRVAEAFRRAFTELGGVVLEEQRYEAGGSDFSVPLRALFNLDVSERRYRAVASVLGGALEFEPRRRQDVDAVMIAAAPREARLLQPQIRFHRGLGLPIVATSHAYSGTPDPQADSDMDGMLLVETPWLLLPAEHLDAPAAPAALAAVWPESRQRLPRLYALGEDAYRLSRFVRALERASRDAGIVATTGRLSVNAEGQVLRALPAGRFSGGRLEPLDLPPVYFGGGRRQ